MAQADPPDSFYDDDQVYAQAAGAYMNGVVYWTTPNYVHYFLRIYDTAGDDQCGNLYLRTRGYYYSEWQYLAHVCGNGQSAIVHRNYTWSGETCCNFIEFGIKADGASNLATDANSYGGD
ncbi:hypothetical protein [Rhodococcus opacus]|uniref:hypothetical protein n=1 Tax=Rhodococcus opacus TaxID=37919 RepID=UPI0006BB4486|nr:hypothetical protein [Rhodococcus opacus]